MIVIANPKKKPEPKFRKGEWFWVIGLVFSLGWLIYDIATAELSRAIWWAFWCGACFGCLFATHARWESK
jgi:hypothetical protein